MAELRAVYVVAKRQQEAIFARRFPNVEQRCSRDVNETWLYVPVPRDDDFVRLFMRTWATAADEELSDRVCVAVGPLWPVVFVEQDDFVFFAVVKVANLSSTSRALIEHLEVTSAVTFLKDMSTFAKQLILEDSRELYEKLAEMNLYLNFAAPFGRVMDMPLAAVRTLFRVPFTDKQVIQTGQKQPPWKPYNPRGKQQMHLTFREEISAVQYDSSTTPDTWDIVGSVLCKAELEGVPDVTVALVPGTAGTMSALAVHSCVQAEDFVQTRKIVFSPPTETIPLCTYRITDFSFLPIRGFYQMKEIDRTSVKILVQLKLSDKVHNNFEYCQLVMPFSHRGAIVQLDVSPTTGMVSLSTNRQTLIWNIGNKFTGRNREVALPGTIYFQGATNFADSLGASASSLPTDTSFDSSRAVTMTQQYLGSQTAAGPLTVVAGSLSTDMNFNGSSTFRSSTHSTTGLTLEDSLPNSDRSASARAPRFRPSFAEVGENSDPFCVNSTAYVKLRFKLPEDNLSGCSVDPQSVGLYPTARVKLTSSRELVSGDYIIWNSLGEARTTMAVPAQPLPL